MAKKRKVSSGMDFMSEELAQARVDELKAYNRPALRKGKRVYEVLGWK